MSQYIQDFIQGRPFGDGVDGNGVISSNTTIDTGLSCSGTSGSSTLTVGTNSWSNGDLIAIFQVRGTGVENWEINRISSGGGTTTLTLSKNLTNTYTDSGASQGEVTKIKRYNDITINASINWSAPTWAGNTGGLLVFSARGNGTVTGNIIASGTGFVGGDGGAAGGYNDAYQGEGTIGAGSVSISANGNAGGGGLGTSGNRFGGGGGGNGAAGSNQDNYPNGGAGGAASGTAALTTMTFGGAGGGGGGDTNSAGGRGGNGGGIIIGFVNNLIVTGTIISKGDDGGAPGGNGAGGGGAGGAGGSILFKVKTATLGNGLITAPAGAGNTAPVNDGANGAVGRIRVDYSKSITGTTTPTLSSSQDLTLVETDSSFLLKLI